MMKKKNTFQKMIVTLATAAAIFFAPVVYSEADAASVAPQTFQSEASKFLGVKYKTAGTTANGFDCSGYVQAVMKNLGVNLPRTSRSMFNVGTPVAKSDLQPGDLVFFSGTSGGKNITHVGMYYGDGKFIHSQNTYGVSITSINDKWYWGSRYVGAKRVLN